LLETETDTQGTSSQPLLNSLVEFIATPSAATMPSILNDEDKETVKRMVPKQTNKIQAVAVARLYVAYPNKSKWSYTGLQGAIVLSNDLVGNTFWLKLVDISVSGDMHWIQVALLHDLTWLTNHRFSVGWSRSTMGSRDL
jgi:hypothetical protein